MNDVAAPTSLPSSGPAAASLRRSESERLDALTSWLAAHVPDARGPFTLERIAGGQSNPSWALWGADRAWVLRAKPGPVTSLAPSAHAIEREYRVQAALAGSAVPVPTMRALCEDESVFGAAFYIMDYVTGRVLPTGLLPGATPDERRACHDAALTTLAALHNFDWRRAGLVDFGRSGQFFERTVRRWTQQYRASVANAAAMPAMERLAEWLPVHIPPGADDSLHTTLTHGDFRFENLMFHPTAPQVVAVLDWELSTLGHPLSDLAYYCTAWHLPEGLLRGIGAAALRHPGVPDEAQVIERYCALTGRDVQAVRAHWPFYLACNLFRIAAILAGIGARVRQGLAANAQAADIARLAEPVAEIAWSVAARGLTAPCAAELVLSTQTPSLG